jgi:hypothetical protein
MDEIKRLGNQIRTALNADVPAELVAAIATTNHAGRLQTLFLEASAVLLSSHRAVQKRPFSMPDSLQRIRSKALVDLLRSRMWAIGCRRPSVSHLISLLNSKRPSAEIVAIKKAA